MTAGKPYVLSSVATSIDGCIDDATETRLLLSNAADFDRVDEVRASMDAILVGAATIRADDPRLMVRSQARKDARVAAGKTPSLIKVTMTTSGLASESKFFTTGEEDKIAYTSTAAHGKIAAQLADVATVVDAGDPIDLETVLVDLAERGVERLMVEGGGSVHTQFLSAGLVDELHLVIAPSSSATPTRPDSSAPRSSPRAPSPRSPSPRPGRSATSSSCAT